MYIVFIVMTFIMFSTALLSNFIIKGNAWEPILLIQSRLNKNKKPQKSKMAAVTSIHKQPLDAPFKAQFSCMQLESKYDSPYQRWKTNLGSNAPQTVESKKEKIGRNKGEQNWGQKKEELH